MDYFLADSGITLSEGERRYLQRAAASAGAEVTFADLAEVDASSQRTSRHDPEKLAAAITSLVRGN